MMTFYRYAAAALVLSLPSCTESLNDPLPSPIDDTVVVAVDSKGNNSTAFTMIAGSSRSLAVYVLDSHKRSVAGRTVTWTSNDTSVVRVASHGNCGPGVTPGCYATSIVAVGGGVARVTASVGTVSAVIDVSVWSATSEAAGVRVAFEVIEFLPRHYAPLINVTEILGREVTVVGFLVSIPGVTDILGGGFHCDGSVQLGTLQSKDLLHEVYGDYALTFDGASSTSNVATATVYVRDGSGSISTSRAIGAIVAGTFPSTYTGGYPETIWDCNWTS